MSPAPLALLISNVGDRTVALPLTAVERILRMAAVTPCPGAPAGVVGLLNYRGAVLPVVDPRPSLNLAPANEFHPDQHLVLVCAAHRYLLLVDRVETIAWVDAAAHANSPAGVRRPPLSLVARLEGRVVPVLAPEALDPGDFLQQADLLPDLARTGA